MVLWMATRLRRSLVLVLGLEGHYAEKDARRLLAVLEAQTPVSRRPTDVARVERTRVVLKGR